MEEAIRIFRTMVTSGRGLSEIVAALHATNDFVLTPFNLLRIANDALGMSVTESRALLEPFDAEMNPTVSPHEIDRIGEAAFAAYRTNGHA